jgi:putative DNA primase/helicase
MSEIVHRIKTEVSPAAVLERHDGTRCIKSGSVLKAFCPFHDENTPSFIIHPDNRWTCYGACDAHGDIIELYCRLKGYDTRKDFKRAVSELARDYLGISVDESPTARETDHRKLWPFNLPDTKVYHFPEGMEVKFSKGGKKDFVLCTMEPDGLRWGVKAGEYWQDSKGVWRQTKGQDRPGAPVRVMIDRRFSLYRPDIFGDANPSAWVWLCEGPKDAETAISLGLIATSGPSGAGTFAVRHAEQLAGRSVAVVLDNDTAGLQALKKRPKILAKYASRVRVLPFFRDPKEEKFDLTDYVEERREAGTDDATIRDELEAILEATPDWTPRSGSGKSGTTTPSGNGDRERSLTDSGLADKFAQMHQGVFAHCAPLHAWLRWIGYKWSECNKHEELGAARAVIEALLKEAKDEKSNDPTWSAMLANFARSSLSARSLRACIDLARGHERIAVDATEFDTDPFVLNCPNGIYDLNVHNFQPHPVPLRVMRATATPYDPAAKCEGFAAFVGQIIVDETGDPDLETIEVLQRAAGYSLTGDVSEKCLFLLWGDGDNGKSLLIHLLSAVLGDYCTSIRFDSLLHSRMDRETAPELADLHGARVAWATESGGARGFDEATVKNVTGGDVMVARRKYANPVRFKPTHKLWLATNSLPKSFDQSRGFWSRIKLIRLRASFMKNPDPENPLERKADSELLDKLKVGAPGILNWCIEGLKKWQQDGLGTSRAIESGVAEYKESQNPVQAFVDEICLVEPGATMSSAEFREEYRKWCERENEKELSTAVSNKYVSRIKGVTPCKLGKGSRRRGWVGIRIRSAFETGGDTPDDVGLFGTSSKSDGPAF